MKLNRDEIFDIIDDMGIINVDGNGSVYREVFERKVTPDIMIGFEVVVVTDLKGTSSRQVGDRIVFEQDYQKKIDIENYGIFLDGDNIASDNDYLKDLILERIEA